MLEKARNGEPRREHSHHVVCTPHTSYPPFNCIVDELEISYEHFVILIRYLQRKSPVSRQPPRPRGPAWLTGNRTPDNTLIFRIQIRTRTAQNRALTQIQVRTETAQRGQQADSGPDRIVAAEGDTTHVSGPTARCCDGLMESRATR